MGTDIEALSINANWYGVNRDVAEKMIQLENEKLAELVAQDPQRFVAFASMALEFPDVAADQFEEAVKEHHLVGAAIGGQGQ
jgi:aminocarboxymuconate-semialdehyde decarboxylase